MTSTGSMVGEEESTSTTKGTYSLDGDILSITGEDGESEKGKITNRDQNNFVVSAIGKPEILVYKRRLN